jgi:hypothetical protein
MPAMSAKHTVFVGYPAAPPTHHFLAGTLLLPRAQVPELDTSPAAAAAAAAAAVNEPRPPDTAPPRAGGVVWLRALSSFRVCL